METFSAGIDVRALPFTEVRVIAASSAIDRVPVQAAIVVACEGVETGAERDCPVAHDLLRLPEPCRIAGPDRRGAAVGEPDHPEDARRRRIAPIAPRAAVHDPADPQEGRYDRQNTGTGDTATSGQNVAVHYTGWLFDPAAPDNKGRNFDSSRDRGEPSGSCSAPAM